jgi:hypothetical protein
MYPTTESAYVDWVSIGSVASVMTESNDWPMLESRDVKTDEGSLVEKLALNDCVILLRLDSLDAALSFSNKVGFLNSTSSWTGDISLLGLLTNPNDRRSICFNGDWEGDLADLGVLDGDWTNPGFFAGDWAAPGTFAADEALVDLVGGGILP